MDGLSEKLLIKDYHACYSVHEDLELLRQAYPDMYPFNKTLDLKCSVIELHDNGKNERLPNWD